MQDNEPINLTYGQMSDMVNRIEQIPSLSGEGAPTTSTPAFHLGQTYIDTTTGDMYYCSEAISESGSLPEYTWELVTEETPEYVAGDNVTITDESGSMVISATDTTYSNFVGTDGTAAGTAGLVPAPATTDAGKFLKADGTWDTAGGGGSGATELTSADYDYHTSGSTDDGVALWRLNPGMYVASGPVKVYVQNINYYSKSDGEKIYFISNADNEGKTILESYNSRLARYGVDSSGNLTSTTQYCQYVDIFANSENKNSVRIGGNSNSGSAYSTAVGFTSNAQQKGAISIGAYSRTSAAGEMNIGSTQTSYGYKSSNYRLLTGLYDPQSAHDAATKGYVDPTTDSSAPTTATVGRLGQIQIDTTTATAYMCVEADDVTPSYTWKQITA